MSSSPLGFRVTSKFSIEGGFVSIEMVSLASVWKKSDILGSFNPLICCEGNLVNLNKEPSGYLKPSSEVYMRDVTEQKGVISNKKEKMEDPFPDW